VFVAKDVTSSWILAVEDNPADMYLLRVALRQHAVSERLEGFENGQTALEWIDRIESGTAPAPCLLIVDLYLPLHGGIELFSRCKSVPALKGVPIVVLTASDSPLDRIVRNEWARCFLRSHRIPMTSWASAPF
jgi:CheY-like chemotaxis protein